MPGGFCEKTPYPFEVVDFFAGKHISTHIDFPEMSRALKDLQAIQRLQVYFL